MAMQDPAAPAKDETKKAEKAKSTISGTVSAITDSSLTIVDNAKAEHTLLLTVIQK